VRSSICAATDRHQHAIIGPSGANVGIGFAVPVNMARSVMTQLVRFGEVRRAAWHRFRRSRTRRRAMLKLPTRTARLSPPCNLIAGGESGLRRGDVVLAFNGRAVKSGPDLRNRLGLTRCENIELTVFREGGN